jgi:glycerophosphoryl diester phosphodiesterase
LHLLVTPKFFAHRGAAQSGGENTLAAFRAAAGAGADGVELDVRPTADGALAVHHDAHLPDGRAVALVAAASLPPHVPLLDAALDACGDLVVNVEIKSDPAEPGFDESRWLAAPVVAAVRAWGGATVVSSFDPAMVDRVRQLDADLPTAQLTTLLAHSPEATVGDIVARGHGWWHPWNPVLDEPDIAIAHDAGLRVNTWTVNDAARIVELAAWGVDAIVSDDVAAARAALA